MVYDHVYILRCILVFFIKQKTAYEMRISDWSSDVGSSDLTLEHHAGCVIFGCPMSANDDHLPFIRQEIDFIPKVLKSGTPFLGVCLGAQLLARAGSSDERRVGKECVSPCRSRLQMYPTKNILTK